MSSDDINHSNKVGGKVGGIVLGTMFTIGALNSLINKNGHDQIYIGAPTFSATTPIVEMGFSENDGQVCLREAEMSLAKGEELKPQWEKASPYYRHALALYSTIAEKLPDTELSKIAQSKIDGFYLDPILQEAKKNQIIQIGDYTIHVDQIFPREYIESMKKYTDCSLWINLYENNGDVANIIDLAPNNPLTTRKYLNLRNRDFTPDDILPNHVKDIIKKANEDNSDKPVHENAGSGGNGYRSGLDPFGGSNFYRNNPNRPGMQGQANSMKYAGASRYRGNR